MTVAFEESTRCPDCLSDKIYAFVDSDGGVCYECCCLIPGPIKGGITIHEVRRLRGELEKLNVKKETPEPKKLEPANGNVQTVQVKKPEPPKTENKMSIWKRFVASIHKPKTETPKPKEAVKPKTATDPGEKRVVKPLHGEIWAVGPCSMCGLRSRMKGRVISPSYRKFVTIEDEVRRVYSGCLLCAKKWQ